MKYNHISADCHIDLCWLPHDLFVSNASAAMKEHMPYVTESPEGPKWVTKSGLDLGFANGKGSVGAVGGGATKYVAGERISVDRIASTGLFADGAQGKLRPTTPELRLQDQDRDGIQAEVMYGLHRSGKQIRDREAAIEFYHIYNDWLSDFCSYDRKRFVGLASIPSYSVEAAVAETHRVSKLEVGGLEVLASWDMIPLWTPYWDPFWKAAADVNLPVHFHGIGHRTDDVSVPKGLPEASKMAGVATRVAGGPQTINPIVAAVIHGGALEQYPSLRVVFGECGIGWIPYFLQRMDHEYEQRFKSLIPHMKMKPSEYWRRQCRATFQDDQVGTKLLDDLGVETAMWASDYPHPDGVFPDSQEYIKRQFGHLPNAIQRKITCENAGKFYGLM